MNLQKVVALFEKLANWENITDEDFEILYDALVRDTLERERARAMKYAKDDFLDYLDKNKHTILGYDIICKLAQRESEEA